MISRMIGHVRQLFAELRQIRVDAGESRASLRAIQDSMEKLSSALAVTPAGGPGRPASQAPSVPTTWPPGHFYSPICDPADLAARRAVIFARDRDPAGVELRADAQLRLLTQLSAYGPSLPFADEKSSGLRYHYGNEFFNKTDAGTYACMMQHFRPKRIVEIGSGYSSALALDVNELFLDRSCRMVFVEPNPENLYRLTSELDRSSCEVQAVPVQDMDLAAIDALEAGDFLFIDSTHVSKTGSDVNFELFTILPRLEPGVYIHFHDIFHPFEYPENWAIEENRSWSELYLLRAFLTANEDYEIVLFNDYLAHRYRKAAAKAVPAFETHSGGSLWLRKLR